jgi:hypothetical protein
MRATTNVINLLGFYVDLITEYNWISLQLG